MGKLHAPWSRLLLAVFALTLVLAGVAAAVGAPPADAAGRKVRRSRVTTPTIAVPSTTTTVAPTTTSAPPTTAPVASAPRTTAESRVLQRIKTAPTPAPSTTTTVPPAPAGGAGSVLFGVATEGGATDAAGISAFEQRAGKKISLYSSYASFYYDQNFNTTAANAVRSRGAIPMVTWEPWDPRSGSAAQPAYSLASIITGQHDAYLSRYASQIKAWGQPLWLRFAHEMNGDWYPWGEKANNNRPGEYVAAWRHVHDLFRQVGVTNVTWVWTPNVLMPNTPSLSSLYPGDAYVDWVGLDGYNWGNGSWQSFDSVFGASLAELRRITSRPIVIGETASNEVGGNKAQWITDFFASMARNSSIRAFVWFNMKKEADWRIESSAAAQQAFSAGVADPRYRAG